MVYDDRNLISNTQSLNATTKFVGSYQKNKGDFHGPAKIYHIDGTLNVYLFFLHEQFEGEQFDYTDKELI